MQETEQLKPGPTDAHFIREKELAFIREKPLATPKEIRDFVSMLTASGEIQITGK